MKPLKSLKILFIIFSLFHVYSFITIFPASPGSFSLLISTLLLRFLLIFNINIKQYLASFILWLNIELAFLAGPALHSLLSNQYVSSTVNSIFAFELGETVLIIFIICFILFSNLFKIGPRGEIVKFNRKKNQYWLNISYRNFHNTFILFLVVTFSFSLISYSLGLGSLVKRVSLPGELDGFIVLFLKLSAPLLFIYFIEGFYKLKGKKFAFRIIFIYGSWLLFESISRGSSGGTLFMGMLPVIIWIYLNDLFTKKQLTYSFIVLSFLVFFGPVIKAYRGISNFSWLDLGSLSQEYYKLNDFGEALLGHYDRLFFRTYNNIEKFYKESPSNYMGGFDFEKINSYGGSTQFHTFYIDKVPHDVVHSSGITFFSDSYLLGGVFLTLVSVIIFTFFARLLDKRLLFKNITFYDIIYIFLFYGFLSGGFWHLILFKYQKIFVLLSTLLFFRFVRPFIIRITRHKIAYFTQENPSNERKA